MNAFAKPARQDEAHQAGPRLNPAVFWPPFVLMLGAVVFNLTSPLWFRNIVGVANQWLLIWFGWLYTLTALLCFVLCIWLAFSPLGRVRLGGRDAKPLMSFWNWFSITLCTTIAIGILFWSTAEPLTHFVQPPAVSGAEPQSAEAGQFALAALYLHWTFVPYSIYCTASILFAFAFYNMQLPFSLGSMLVPLTGNARAERLGPVIDAVCLYALVAGMAAALGTGILTISGGFGSIWGVPRSSIVWGGIAVAIVATFILSSASGLMKGIRVLSDINAKGLFVLGIVVFLVGPITETLTLGAKGLMDFGSVALTTGVVEGLFPTDPWTTQWSIFYWAVWMAWTPITACFLGRIAYGRTIREFLLVNLVLTSLFSLTWMAVWGSTTILLETNGQQLFDVMESSGVESVSYSVMAALPWGQVMVVFYLLSAFVCFVTSADSNTTAMASISSTGVTLERPEAPVWLKFVWGILVGLVAWVMITFADVDGIRMMSNLGGFPAACLLLLVIVSLFKVSWNPQQYNHVDRHGGDSTETASSVGTEKM
jgi:glycine betaine transporter